MVLVGLVERLDQDLDRLADLIAKLIGDFLLIVGTLVEQGFERFVLRHAEEAVGTEQRAEGPQRDRLLQPEVCVPGDVAGRFVLRGVHQHPVIAVGDDAQPDARVVQQLHHAGVGRGLPA